MQSQNQDNDNGRSAPFVRRATQQTSLSELWSQNISIHPLREEGDATGLRISDVLELHFYPRPPRGGRLKVDQDGPCYAGISIHALREEGDGAQSDIRRLRSRFLSTPSARRATRGPGAAHHHAGISIHALREEGDYHPHFHVVWMVTFLSTPSARRATVPDMPGTWYLSISIHALREEGDGGCCRAFNHPRDFYPRPPRGGRPV